MHQIAFQIINQQVTFGGANRNNSYLLKHQPLQSRNVLGLDRGQLGPDLGPKDRVVRVGPIDDENEISVGDGDGVGVECAEEVGVVDEPVFLAGAEVREIGEGYWAYVGCLDAFRHVRCRFTTLDLEKKWRKKD